MSSACLSFEYIAMLHSAMRRPEVRAYALSRLETSLSNIGIAATCRRDVMQLLMTLTRDESISQTTFAEAISAFGIRWRTHLDRAYFRDYEASRWDYVKQFVFSKVTGPLGRCLDVGCGRGCFTVSIIEKGLASEAVGVDDADFSAEWSERCAASSLGVSFHQIAVEDISRWTISNGRYDTVLLFYVLHHSSDYWVAKTLEGLSHVLKRDGRIIILEDSLVLGGTPADDPYNLVPQWRGWVGQSPSFLLSTCFDIQIVLDFVAVQLLARFFSVQMPCNYKTSNEWISVFEGLGYEVSIVENIGFPAGRDIDVPQALFVIQARK